MVEVLDRILQAARQLFATDVILKAGLPPIFRIRTELRTVQNVTPLSKEVIGTFALNMMNARQRKVFEEQLECDLAYSTADGERYRVSAFHQRGQVEMVMRVIPSEIPSFESLTLPPVLLRLAEEARGLVLVTGVTGSGKSTTLAAMVEHVNTRRACHIVTVEDPIEYVFRDRRSVVTQRELGLDTLSFSRALRASLRQNPDVIFVGEMRDVETITIALQAAETGHLVLSTLHTADAVETVNRVVGVFPQEHRAQTRLQLGGVLRGVVSQRLLPRADGKALVPAVEVMVGTQRVRELIEDPTRTGELYDAMAQGRNPYGMQTFDQSLTELVMKKLVTYQDALRHSTRADDFALQFRGISSARGMDWETASAEFGGEAAAATSSANAAVRQTGQRPTLDAQRPPRT